VKKKIHGKWVLSCLLAFCVVGLASQVSAQSVIQLNPDQSFDGSLQDIIDQGLSIQVGDKLFDAFSFTSAPSSGFLAADVAVQAVQDQFGFGLEFSGSWVATDTQERDFVLGFGVTVLDQSQLVHDVHLLFNGSEYGSGQASVTEQIFDDGPVPLGNLIGQMAVDAPSTLENIDLFQPLRHIYVEKDVSVTGGLIGEKNSVENMARITTIHQTFSQIPEPGTMLLVAVGLFGAMLTTRRRR
jgi:hypothetical protein